MAAAKAVKRAETLEDAKTEREKAEGATPIERKYPKGVEVLSSETTFAGPLFKVQTDMVREPGGPVSRRDVVRHGGSVVILAVDSSQSQRNPRVLVERQYRHAAAQYLIELPAGKIDPGETPLQGAKRELLEETGYKARRWSKLARFFASPGFLGEWMQVFLAEQLTPGDAQPEEDERIQLSAVPLSELVQQIAGGKIHDGKTIAAVLLYDHLRRHKTSVAR